MSRKKLNPLERFERVEYAVGSLTEFIIEGNLKPGTELPPEREMAKQIGVSKFSMREALRVLQAQGLVDISQGRRTRVADLSVGPATQIMSITLRRSKSPLFHLTEARRSLEGAIARFAAIRAEVAQIEAMQKTFSKMEHNKGNLKVCVEEDIKFHNILVRASKNIVFEMMFIPLIELLSDTGKSIMRVATIKPALARLTPF